MAIPAILDLVKSTDSQTKGFIARCLVITVCLLLLIVVGAVIYLSVVGHTIPSILTALLSSLVGAAVLGLGAHSSASIVSDAVVSSVDAVASSIAAQQAPVQNISVPVPSPRSAVHRPPVKKPVESSTPPTPPPTVPGL